MGLVAAVALGLVLHAMPAWADEAAAVPGRVLVKYRAGVEPCAGCLGGRGRRTLGDRTALDRLHATLGVQDLVPLFGVAAGSAARSRSLDDRVARIRQRHPERAGRGRGAVPDLSRWFVLVLPADADLTAAAAALAAHPEVEAAELDHVRDAELLTNDPFLATTGTWGQPYPDLWGLHLVGAPAAWDVGIGTGTLIAVIDTGVDRAHPDLAANMWTNPGEVAGNGVDDDTNGFIDDVQGWDFVASDGDPRDQHGHGTHCAGTAAATGGNGVGVVGMAFGARVMAVRGLDANGRGADSNLAKAIVYAVENGADVVSASWGGPGADTMLHDAVQLATSLGTVVVAAAGNNGGDADFHYPSAFPEVIAVGASRWDDVIAGFSNHGDSLSVAAPGVDVLSTRGSTSEPVGGQPVGTGYLRLNGTSMATPHVAGLAAVLLSAMPSLTVDEVRWHLELNAHQPGAPGWEGDAWNPWFGYGRIDAGRVFDVPPVTTRVRPHAISLHALAGTVTPAAATVDFQFTTLDPVAWTLDGPTWLQPATGAGSGPASVAATLDTTALAPGTVSDVLALEAPAALDGGAAVDATVVVHRDERMGPAVTFPHGEITFDGAPSVASNGLGSVVVYGHIDTVFDPQELRSAFVDPSGAVTAGFLLDAGHPFKSAPRIAGDGRGYFVVWEADETTLFNNKETGFEAILGMRLDAVGAPLDASPIVVATRKFKKSTGLVDHHVASDGESWIVTWADQNSQTDVSSGFFTRVGRDGSLPKKPVKFYPNAGTTLRQVFDPHVACHAGTCLIAYHQADGETDPSGGYVDKLQAVRVVGSELVGAAGFQVLRDAESVSDLVATTAGWVVYADRDHVCPGATLCDSAVAARIAADGTPLDPNGVVLNLAPPAGSRLGVRSGTFDGTAFVGTFLEYIGDGAQIFAGRLGLDGSVLDDELEGLLLHPEPTVSLQLSGVSAASTRTHSVLAWADHLEDGDVQQFAQVRVQRVLPHAPTDGLGARAIGSIGALAVPEDQRLAFVLAAPGLAPGTTVFSATNLPPGAELDATTGAFQWTPAPDESGLVLPPIHFAASDGSTSVAEDVAIDVVEAVASLGGTLRLGNGTPVAGATLRIVGTEGGPRTVRTDAAGRYRLFGLPRRVYRVKLDKPTKQEFRATPGVGVLVVDDEDVLDVDFVLAPR